MKYFVTYIIIIVTLLSCSGERENLHYPKDISEISEVVLERPDKASHGKFAKIQKLTEVEIIQLLNALKNANPTGPTKFIPDFYIIFTTKLNETTRIKINKNTIKGYDSDYSYRIERIEFLINF